MAKRVLVTGCSGFFGTTLTKALLGHPLVRRVVGVDSRPPALEARPAFRYVPADIRDGVYVRSLLEEEDIDTVFHLAFLLGEFRERLVAHSLNVTAGMALAEAASKAGRVQKFVVASSAAAYGAFPDNPVPLTEDAPLRASSWPYAYWKRVLEWELTRALPELRPGLQVSVLRICWVVSPRGSLAGPVRRFIESRWGLSALLRDCPLQFISEDDLARVMLRILEVPEFRGAYNVAPEDTASLKALCRRLKALHVRLPYSLLWASGLVARWLLPEWGFSEGLAPYLAYPVVLDSSRLKKALGMRLGGSEESFLACAAALLPGTLPPAEPSRAPQAPSGNE